MSRWLGDDHLVKSGRATDWKKQYKLRHNWSKGNCSVSETEIAERPPISPILVQFYGGIIITVDSTAGLRAWQTEGDQKLIATITLSEKTDGPTSPTSLAIDTFGNKLDELRIAVGFINGRFSIFRLLRKKENFTHLCTHAISSNGIISAIAYASPYILLMSGAQLLSFYQFSLENDNGNESSIQDPPVMLSSLNSYTAWPPVSLAIRSSPSGIFASIAYSMPTYLAGWSVGMQELRLTFDGNVLESRIASALSHGFTPSFEVQSTEPLSRAPSSSRETEMFRIDTPSSKPTSLSYTHPYLLSTHPDNTLMLYMVTSNANDLSISMGHRLWGHTSSISGAHVGDRGKAVSVSTHGNELRVWELEGGISSNASKRRIATGEASVQVRPGEKTLDNNAPESNNTKCSDHPHLGLINSLGINEAAITNGWVDFDEEKVVVLRENDQGKQSLVVYDFT